MARVARSSRLHVVDASEWLDDFTNRHVTLYTLSDGNVVDCDELRALGLSGHDELDEEGAKQSAESLRELARIYLGQYRKPRRRKRGRVRSTVHPGRYGHGE